MSRDNSENSKRHERTISKPRIVAGLMGEIDAAGVLVILSEVGTDRYFTARIESEFRVPFESSTLKIKDAGPISGTYLASALFAGQRLTFEVTVLDTDGNCSFPKEVKIADLRLNKRRKFGSDIEFAEIFTKHGVLMATPVDMSQNSIALNMNSKDSKLIDGENVRIVIRGRPSGPDIFAANLSVKDFCSSGGLAKVLLGPTNPREDVSGTGPLRLTSRHEMAQLGFLVSPLDSNLGEPIYCPVSDVSMTGFQCRVPSAESISWLMPGIHVSLRELSLTATVMWRIADNVGMRISALDESASFQTWTAFLRKHKIGHGFHHSQVDELVNLFTESGLLKGKRRKLFGTDPSGYLPSSNVLENSLLYHRVMSTSSNGKLSGHLSVGRLTDDAWYFQEGSHIGGDGSSFRELYASTISLGRSLYRSSKLNPRFLAGLYHANIKSAGTFGVELFADPSSRVYPLFQSSISSNLPTDSPTTKVSILSPNDLDAEGRRDALSTFDPTLVETFIGWNGSHPRLNAELSKLGSHHEAKSVLVRTGDRVWGLAYRLRSYYALNSTGVMNSLFFVTIPTVTADEVQAALLALAENGLAFGSDDVAIVVCAKPGDEVSFLHGINEPKPFTFFVIDNHLNREFLGSQEESEASLENRRKRE